jgi:hypothetical protein
MAKMLSKPDDSYANSLDLIITHFIHASKHHIITQKYTQLFNKYLNNIFIIF